MRNARGGLRERTKPSGTWGAKLWLSPTMSTFSYRRRIAILALQTAALAIAFAPANVDARDMVPLSKTSESTAVALPQSFMTAKVRSGRVIFQLPKAVLGQDLLWYVERGSVSTTVKEGAGGATSTLLVRLERLGDAVVIRNLTPGATRRAATAPSDPSKGPTSDQKVPPIARAVAESTLAPPIAILPLAPESTEDVIHLDVTDVFKRDLPELRIQSIFGGATLDPSRSFIEGVRNFPTNVLVTVLVTVQPSRGGDSLAGVLKHSWTLLPKQPMVPRRFDPRVGIFALDFEEYAAESNRGSEARSVIRRYRLEKKDPSAPISEPIKPIVYYIGRTVPDKWRKYMKQGVEDWQVAFEAAGFRNAIIAKDAPSEKEDPNWDPSDTRHSVIRWVANPIPNAIGPNIADPRTGEILSAHILIWEDVLKLANDWYYSMCSAVDTRAQTLPLSDEIAGRMMRYIVSHEVGHTLGLRHNHRASTAYTVAQLRDPAFCAKHGSTASIMAYGRMNYVAQPGDGHTPESLIPRVGPYDNHAIRWSYAPLAPADEAKTLEAWAREAETNDWLALGGEDFAALVDPRVLTQNIGRERIAATRLGLKNLAIAMANLVGTYRKGASTYEGLYDRWMAVLNVRHDYLSSVVMEIGGREETRTGTHREPQFRGVSAARQREALSFLLSEGFHWDPVYYSSGVIPNALPLNLSHPMRNYQSALLGELFAPYRIGLISEGVLDGGNEKRFGLVEYFGMMADGIFQEAKEFTNPSLLRRDLQREFLRLVEAQRKVNPTVLSEAYAAEGAPGFILESLTSTLGTDTLAALRVTLQKLEVELKAAAGKAKDPLVRGHWEECLSQTRRLLSS